MSLRLALGRTSVRRFTTTLSTRTTAGYGDPQDEKADNNTPRPSSSSDPQPSGQGKGVGAQSGTTDPEIGKGKTGSAGGDKGSGEKTASAKEIKETKKVGEEPKNESVGGAGPIGG